MIWKGNMTQIIFREEIDLKIALLEKDLKATLIGCIFLHFTFLHS